MVSPKTAQNPCTTDAQILHPRNCLHGDNRFASSESSPFSFMTEGSLDPELMWGSLKSCAQSEWVSESRIKSGMTKEILFQ